jgi:hypothetical protein
MGRTAPSLVLNKQVAAVQFLSFTLCCHGSVTLGCGSSVTLRRCGCVTRCHHGPILSAVILCCHTPYSPFSGLRDFVGESVKLAYGEDSPLVANKQVAAVQSLSGTGSCRLFAEYQKRFLPNSSIYIPVVSKFSVYCIFQQHMLWTFSLTVMSYLC